MKTSANPIPPSAGVGSGAGLLGCTVVPVLPGSEGEILGAPPGSCGVIDGFICGVGALPGKDGVMEKLPLDEADGAVGVSGAGADGVGKLGVICACAIIVISGPVNSFICEFPNGQGDGEVWIKFHAEVLADGVAGDTGIVDQCHLDRF